MRTSGFDNHVLAGYTIFVHEILGPNESIYKKSDPLKIIPTELPLPPQVKDKAIVVLVTGNAHVSGIVGKALEGVSGDATDKEFDKIIDVISPQVLNQFLAFSLVLKSDPPKTIANLASVITDSTGDADF